MCSEHIGSEHMAPSVTVPRSEEINLFSFKKNFFFFLGGNSLDCPGFPQKSACLCLLSAGIKGMCYHVWLGKEVLKT